MFADLLPFLALLALSAAAAPGVSPVVTVFVHGEPPSVSNYRIPAAVVTDSGVIVAFAESRSTASSDCGPKALVSRRSSDGGTSWDALTLVYGDVAARQVAGNPMAVFHPPTGRIVVTFALGRPGAGCFGDVMQVRLQTWSTFEITQRTLVRCLRQPWNFESALLVSSPLSLTMNLPATVAAAVFTPHLFYCFIARAKSVELQQSTTPIGDVSPPFTLPSNHALLIVFYGDFVFFRSSLHI